MFTVCAYSLPVSVCTRPADWLLVTVKEIAVQPSPVVSSWNQWPGLQAAVQWCFVAIEEMAVVSSWSQWDRPTSPSEVVFCGCKEDACCERLEAMGRPTSGSEVAIMRLQRRWVL
jgi:hypothetical protein